MDGETRSCTQNKRIRRRRPSTYLMRVAHLCATWRGWSPRRPLSGHDFFERAFECLARILNVKLPGGFYKPLGLLLVGQLRLWFRLWFFDFCHRVFQS
ncbi:protein of unknown function [Methylocella tundrae]|uniref:Uncharacterized protein n=1 Tax=Methylocella tundrae TaxID=227605 RepID=A0A4U8Z169_METTU|nr:protein of unknown function [Methylocella tundrae]